MDFTGQVAISTGAASGMGLLFAQNFAALGGEHFVQIGVVNCGGDDLALLTQRNGDTAMMQTADKIGRAVDGINDKIATLARNVAHVLLLAVKTGIGEGFEQLLAQKCLHRAVIFCHKIASQTLGLHALADILRRAHDQTGLPHNRNHPLQHPDHPFCKFRFIAPKVRNELPCRHELRGRMNWLRHELPCGA